ncbi:MAG: cytochrome P450 [Planctomycetia bacterium]|nr:cytochrome P450 [Planctomycetia bacterium]
MSDKSEIPDPFAAARRKDGVLPLPAGDETIPMLLRHDEVRRAAKDWRTFSSDAPFRVPIPSEEHLRHDRQLPIETDPPDHTDYRDLVEPLFQRAREPAYAKRIEAIVHRLLDESLGRETTEIVEGFALPLQSRALAVLLGVPEAEAERWIDWGVHVFHGGDGESKAAALDAYLHAAFDRAEAAPGDDFFSLLTKVEFRGRRLTRSEMVGFGNLTFAGGRDTIIHTVASMLGHLATKPTAFDFLREDRNRIVLAGEEFFRVFMPLTHIGRVCPAGADVHGIEVVPGGRMSLGWASANLDEAVFECPREVRLDRRPNPHVAFGFGGHLCLGAAHSRAIVRGLLDVFCDRVRRIDLVAATPRVEHTAAYDRPLGYDSLVVRFVGMSS